MQLNNFSKSSVIILLIGILFPVFIAAQEKDLSENVQDSPKLSSQTDSSLASKYPDKDIQELYDKGLEYLNQGKSDSALTYLQEIMHRAFDEVDSKLSLAKAYIRLGSYQKACNTLEKAQELDPERSAIYALRGEALSELERTEEAIQAYQKAVALDSNNVNYLNTLAVLNIQQQNYDVAIPLLKKAVSIKPDMAHFYNNLGVAYEGVNELQQAIELFSTALSIDPAYQKARKNLARVREKNENMSNL